MNTAPINPLIKSIEGSKIPSFDYIYKGYFMELTQKTVSMFEFKGLPETVNERYLKISLILTGNVALWYPANISAHIASQKYPKGWYAVKGTIGAEPDPYYIGSRYTIANPILGSENIETTDKRVQVFYWSNLDEIFNPQTSGLYFLIDRTARILTEIYRSTIIALKNSRLVNIFSASNNNEKRSLNELLHDMREGEDVFTALQDFKSHMEVNPVVSETNVKDILQEFVELEQFHLAQFYHAIGVNSNYNLKRAQINNEEIMTNSYILVVSLADVLPSLQRACEEFNTKSGLSISVDYSPEWQKMRDMQEGLETPNTEDPNSESPNLDEEKDEDKETNEEQSEEKQSEEEQDEEDKDNTKDDEVGEKDENEKS